MNKSFLKLCACPKCRASLSPVGSVPSDLSLVCTNCSSIFPVKSGIPRFVPEDNYARSFGFQWNLHTKTQIDKLTGLQMSCDRFFYVTQWEKVMLYI